jgi:hypothetical protein
MSADRWAQAPAESAAHGHQAAQLAASEAEARTSGGEHHAEVLASHPGQPTPAESVAAGAAAPPRWPAKVP